MEGCRAGRQGFPGFRPVGLGVAAYILLDHSATASGLYSFCFRLCRFARLQLDNVTGLMQFEFPGLDVLQPCLPFRQRVALLIEVGVFVVALLLDPAQPMAQQVGADIERVG